MKKSFNTIILLGFLFCAFSNIFAQERTLTEEEFETPRKNAAEKLKGKAYRVKMTSESYKNVNDSSPYYFTSQTTEYSPPDRIRRIFERKTDGDVVRIETISIGKKMYSRQNNESWKELSPSEGGIGGGISGRVLKNEKTVEYKYKGKTIVNGQKADLYEVKTTIKYDEPDYKSTVVVINRYWLNQDGMYLKTEYESRHNSNKITSHTVYEYEYDSSIKIEAPPIP